MKQPYIHRCSYCEKNIDKFKNTLYNRNWDDIKKLEIPIKHINTFSISLLTFMTIRFQNRKLKLNSRAIRALGLLKILQSHQKRNKPRHFRLKLFSIKLTFLIQKNS